MNSPFKKLSTRQMQRWFCRVLPLLKTRNDIVSSPGNGKAKLGRSQYNNIPLVAWKTEDRVNVKMSLFIQEHTHMIPVIPVVTYIVKFYIMLRGYNKAVLRLGTGCINITYKVSSVRDNRITWFFTWARYMGNMVTF